MAATAIDGSPPQKLLIFSFPDGARGGIGKIQGTGKIVYKDRHWRVVPEDTHALLAACGLRSFKTFEHYHSDEVYAPSTDADVRIVECFKAKTYRHFNVGWGELDRRLGMPRINDEAPFRHFWRDRQASTGKH